MGQSPDFVLSEQRKETPFPYLDWDSYLTICMCASWWLSLSYVAANWLPRPAYFTHSMGLRPTLWNYIDSLIIFESWPLCGSSRIGDQGSPSLVCLYLQLPGGCSPYNFFFFFKDSKMQREPGILSCSLQKVSSSEIPEKANAVGSFMWRWVLLTHISVFSKVANFFVLKIPRATWQSLSLSSQVNVFSCMK